MNARVRELREQGLAKRAAKRAVYGRRSQHVPAPAPIREYHRLAKLKREAAA